jgi:hypothetical protein
MGLPIKPGMPSARYATCRKVHVQATAEHIAQHDTYQQSRQDTWHRLTHNRDHGCVLIVQGYAKGRHSRSPKLSTASCLLGESTTTICTPSSKFPLGTVPPVLAAGALLYCMPLSTHPQEPCRQAVRCMCQCAR